MANEPLRTAPVAPQHRRRQPSSAWVSHAGNVVRGGLIGTVETIPGVSGGTVALVVGVYEDLIKSAGHVLAAVRRAVSDVPRGAGLARARAEFRQASWGVVVPVLIGMGLAVVIAASQIETLYEEHPIQMRALFFGMVVMSLWVPASMAGLPWQGKDYAIALAAAAAAFVIVSIPPGNVDPSAPVIVGAGAIAVSALMLPGLSGSFLLLTMGLYERTLEAVNDRDFGYLGLFALGLVIGLSSFVKLLQWLLDHHHRLTLVALTGVMAGCLRALWPWQSDDRSLLAPGDHVGSTLGLFAIGVAAVGIVILAERKLAHRTQPQ